MQEHDKTENEKALDEALDIQETTEKEIAEGRVRSRTLCAFRSVKGVLVGYGMRVTIAAAVDEVARLNREICDINDGVGYRLSCGQVEAYEDLSVDVEEAFDIVKAAFEDMSNVAHFAPQLHTVIPWCLGPNNLGEPLQLVLDKEEVVIEPRNPYDAPRIQAAIMVLHKHYLRLNTIQFCAESEPCKWPEPPNDPPADREAVNESFEDFEDLFQEMGTSSFDTDDDQSQDGRYDRHDDSPTNEAAWSRAMEDELPLCKRQTKEPKPTSDSDCSDSPCAGGVCSLKFRPVQKRPQLESDVNEASNT